jgi:peptidoglycan/xylan/chitin deacetylase (PgdA/CDA1 family)
MEYVATHYNTVTLEEVHRSQSGVGVIPQHSCVITFDDGYLDVYENAVPVLNEFGLKATFFVIGGPTVSREHPWLHAVHEILDLIPAKECASVFRKVAPDFFSMGDTTKNYLCRRVWEYFLGRDQATRKQFLAAVRAELGSNAKRVYRFMEDRHIRDLRDRGFEIGCHSMDHEYMVQMSDDELRRDIRQCNEVLYDVLGRAPNLFCYPFGSFNDRVIATLCREGFVCACTTTSGLNDASTNPLALYRIGVYTATTFELFVFQLVGLEAGSREMYRFFKSTLTGKGVS